MRRLAIAKEGLLLGGLPFITGLFFMWMKMSVIGIVLCLIGIFILYFFRQPYRVPLSKEGVVYAPADGKIIQITEEHENGFFKETVHKVSIFMSIFNVHITYAPVPGRIEYLQYKPGKFIRANKIKKSLEETNENNFIGICNENGKIAVRQVAGYIARRIVCDVKLGDKLSVGERIGMIKFGSRIDVYLPKEWEINVKNMERTKAGCTILAKRR